MNTKVLKIITRGIKNIEENIELDFTNKTFEKIDLDKSNIKVIYGANGAGKSAIIDSIDIYKGLCMKYNYLIDEKYRKYLNCLLNKINKEFYFKVYFVIHDETQDAPLYYSHEILMSFKNDPSISYEKFSLIKGQSISSHEEYIIYEVNDGKINFGKFDSLFEYYRNVSLNLLNKSSFISLLSTKKMLDRVEETFDLIDDGHKDKNTLTELYFDINLYHLYSFLASIRVKMENEEFSNKFNMIEDLFKEMKTYLIEPIVIDSTEDIIDSDDLEEYDKTLIKLTNFIKLFKSNLQSIDVIKKIDNDSYHCFKTLNYGNYSIDSNYESSGIKKLIELFAYIDRAVNGDIVFIDELDANIGGVFLNKLLEFIQEYGKGQLCFTSHSFEPMEVLKKNSKSIEFFGETGKLVTWIKNGHYTPRNQYKDGMIQDSPFNIESYDFLKVFDIWK